MRSTFQVIVSDSTGAVRAGIAWRHDARASKTADLSELISPAAQKIMIVYVFLKAGQPRIRSQAA
ncbi:MAG: hypothetical protein DWI22_12095 [Planctomycetota bacterium]|nr:MAG: hypothetical protein DWI22_12095 [Planctomycetota bacterium]